MGLLLKDMMRIKLLTQYLVQIKHSTDVHYDYGWYGLLPSLCDANRFAMKDLEILNQNFSPKGEAFSLRVIPIYHRIVILPYIDLHGNQIFILAPHLYMLQEVNLILSTIL